jgi:hypothetical protein
MGIPYTYYLFHRPTGKKYYGVRYAKTCDPADLWVRYFSSSKKVKALILEYGKDSFVAEVRKTFFEVRSARLWEHNVLRRLKAVTSVTWLNEWRGGIRGLDKDRHELSDAARNKIREKARLIGNLPENVEKQRTLAKKLWLTDDFKQANQERLASLWASDSFKSNHTKVMQNVWTDEFRAKRSSEVKEQWNDPNFRRMKSNQSKELWNDLEFKQKMIRLGKIVRIETPNGIFESISACARAYNRSPRWVNIRIKHGEFKRLAN